MTKHQRATPKVLDFREHLRCCVCGDKRLNYIHQADGKYFIVCHTCGKLTGYLAPQPFDWNGEPCYTLVFALLNKRPPA